MASKNEKTPLLGYRSERSSSGTSTHLRSVVGDEEIASLVDVEINESEEKDKLLFPVFRKSSSVGHLAHDIAASSSSYASSTDSKRRKPFYYSSVPTYVTDDGKIEHALDEQTAATFNRYRYYSRLAGSPSRNVKALEIPDHILPPFLLSVELSFKKKMGKQNSMVTIFSIWNTMMGTSLLSIPWAIQKAGFAMGIVLLVVMAGLTLYTCYRVVKSVEKLESADKLLEFSDVCRSYLGRWGEYTAIFFSLVALLGAMVVYWVLMSNFMYGSVSFIYGHAIGVVDADNTTMRCAISPPGVEEDENYNMTLIQEGDETLFAQVWSQTKSVPLFLALLMFPLMNIRSPTFFTKFNALGTMSVLYLLVFVSVEAWQFGGFHLDFNNPDSVDYAALFNVQFPTLSGILALGYFIHMCIASILRTQENPQNNGRDMTIAYLLVAFTYTFVGVVFYAAFPMEKGCLADNLLDNFLPGHVLAFTARVFLLFQMVTLFPLLVFIFRIQLLDPLFGSAYPSWKHVFVLNVLLVTIAVLFAVFLPQIGVIIRFSGAFCGLAYVFTLPCVIYMLELKAENRLTWPIIIVHSCIIAVGAANFIAQFILFAL